MSILDSPFGLQNVPCTPVHVSSLTRIDAVVPNRPETPISPYDHELERRVPGTPATIAAVSSTITPMNVRGNVFRTADSDVKIQPLTPGTRMAQTVPCTPAHLRGTLTPHPTPTPLLPTPSQSRSSQKPLIVGKFTPEWTSQSNVSSAPGVRQINLFDDEEDIFA